MTEIENFWAQDLLNKKINTPVAILKQQGRYLEDITKGVLVGSIDIDNVTIAKGDGQKKVTRVFFSVIAPFMGNYKTTLFVLYQDPVKVYPIELSDNISQNNQLLSTEDEFKHSISKLLSSEEVSSIIGNLLSQSEVVA